MEANTERPTDSTILVRSIARVCTIGSNLHRLDLPDMNRRTVRFYSRDWPIVHSILARFFEWVTQKKKLLARLQSISPQTIEGQSSEPGVKHFDESIVSVSSDN